MAYKAFVSSTFEDLKAHRQVVIASLHKAGIFVDPMEDWTASSDEPKKFSQDRLKDCDLCVLLVAFRRGHVPRDEELSITQLEYRAAIELGIDVLVFMLHEDAPWPRKFDELDEDPGIQQFRGELQESRGVDFFGLEPSSIEISPALTRWIAEKQRSVGINAVVTAPISANPSKAVDPIHAEPKHQRTIEIGGSPDAVLKVFVSLHLNLKPKPTYVGEWKNGDKEVRRDLTVLDEAAVQKARALVDRWNRRNPDSTVLFLDLSADLGESG